MANEYRTWYATTEQNWVTRFDRFLVHVVGWYRAYTYNDSSSNRQYSWVSEGASDDERPARIISTHATVNEIRLDCMLFGTYNFVTGVFGTPYVGSSTSAEIRYVGVPGRCRSIANKDRAIVIMEVGTTVRYSGYVGFINSFYSAADDPHPYLIRGQISSSADWTSNSSLRSLRVDETEATHALNFSTTMTKEGYPNPRNGQFSFFNPVLYYNGSTSFYEVRGRIDGVYFCDPGRLGNGSFVRIGDDFYLVHKTTDEADAMAFGPVSDDQQIPQDVVQLGFPNFPYLKVDYTDRGLELEAPAGGTLALWRFDTGHLGGYVYSSGDTLPVPALYNDEAGTYDLTPQNGLTSVESRLREAADFNGSTQYATATGDAAVSAALNGAWTFECVFKPDTIPTGGNKATLLHFGSVGDGVAAENDLLKVSITAAAGTTPDAFNVELGNVEVFWENGTGADVSNTTTVDLIQQNRWNYLAVVKTENGPNYDIQVWHCSFGDHLTAAVKATFSGVANSSGGSASDWFVGVDAAFSDYYDGQLDDTRITKRAFTSDEIRASCQRAML